MGLRENQLIQSLIVDDDKFVGEILKELVEGEHVAVEVRNDGGEAIEFIKKRPVDIVITDLMMPKVGGLEVLSLAKRMNPDSVVIIITGHGSLETAIEAVREGAYDYIKKPFKLDEIRVSFNNAVEKIRLVRKNKELLEELKETCDQLVAMKKRYLACKEGDKPKQITSARLNFHSANLPSLEFLHEADEGRQKLFERLNHISQLKKDGLLTEKEFTALKTQIIKGVEMYTTT